MNSQAKIIATIGPATRSKAKLIQLVEAGTRVFRLNLSHDTQATHAEAIRLIKEVKEQTGQPITILGDLQGPKLRIGLMPAEGVALVAGQPFSLVNEECEGDSRRAYMNYKALASSVSKGDWILIDDGKIKLEVTYTNGLDLVETRVLNGGVLRSKKGVNLPQTQVNLPCLTEKDLNDLDFSIAQDIDWIGLSFVRSETDIITLKNHILAKGSNLNVVAKIEKPEALLRLDEIIAVSDAIMVARGDLGVEVSFEKVPLIQKEIVNKCMDAGKPVIIATQMLESMITQFTPTRAEANDVANAIIDGADALMLSAETSMGDYPVEAVQAMQRIINWTESKGLVQHSVHPPKDEGRGKGFLTKAICYNAATLAKEVKAKAIVVFSNDELPISLISSHRAYSKILVYTTHPDLLRKLPLVWGVEVFLYPEIKAVAEAVLYAKKHILGNALLQEGDMVVYVGSIPFVLNRPNMVRIGRIEL